MVCWRWWPGEGGGVRHAFLFVMGMGIRGLAQRIDMGRSGRAEWATGGFDLEHGLGERRLGERIGVVVRRHDVLMK